MLFSGSMKPRSLSSFNEAINAKNSGVLVESIFTPVISRALIDDLIKILLGTLQN